jgi:hypothetical protein
VDGRSKKRDKGESSGRVGGGLLHVSLVLNVSHAPLHVGTLNPALLLAHTACIYRERETERESICRNLSRYTHTLTHSLSLSLSLSLCSCRQRQRKHILRWCPRPRRRWQRSERGPQNALPTLRKAALLPQNQGFSMCSL